MEDPSRGATRRSPRISTRMGSRTRFRPCKAMHGLRTMPNPHAGDPIVSGVSPHAGRRRLVSGKGEFDSRGSRRGAPSHNDDARRRVRDRTALFTMSTLSDGMSSASGRVQTCVPHPFRLRRRRRDEFQRALRLARRFAFKRRLVRGANRQPSASKQARSPNYRTRARARLRSANRSVGVALPNQRDSQTRTKFPQDRSGAEFNRVARRRGA